MARSLKNLFYFIFKVYYYVFEVVDSKSDVKLPLLTVGSCQVAVKLTTEYKRLKIMISPYVFEVAEFKSDVKMTKLAVGSCQLAVKLTEEYKKLKKMILSFKLKDF